MKEITIDNIELSVDSNMTLVLDKNIGSRLQDFTAIFIAKEAREISDFLIEHYGNEKLEALTLEALQTEGSDHKQWYLEQIYKMLHGDTKNITWNEGKAP